MQIASCLYPAETGIVTFAEPIIGPPLGTPNVAMLVREFMFSPTERQFLVTDFPDNIDYLLSALALSDARFKADPYIGRLRIEFDKRKAAVDIDVHTLNGHDRQFYFYKVDRYLSNQMVKGIWEPNASLAIPRDIKVKLYLKYLSK